MLRVFGALLLPLCGWLTGDAFQQRTRERLCALEWSIRLLQRIRQEIAFRWADLTQLDAQPVSQPHSSSGKACWKRPQSPGRCRHLPRPKYSLKRNGPALRSACPASGGRAPSRSANGWITTSRGFRSSCSRHSSRPMPGPVCRTGLGWQPVWCWRSSFSESGRTKRWKLISCSRSRRSASSWRCSTSF